MKYQIRDWDSHFENDRSRNRQQCSFVCVPNKQHGMGFCRIMAEPDGAAIYGIWHCIVGACSQQKRRNGWLTADGDCNGSAWGADDLSLKLRRPEPEIARALEFLSSDKVGWLLKYETPNKINGSPSSHHEVTADSPRGIPKERTNEEKEEKEGRERTKLGEGSLLTGRGGNSIRLFALCEDVLGKAEMDKHKSRWQERIFKNPTVLEKVLSDVRIMALEHKIKKTPAAAAEDLLKRFQ